MIAVRYGNSLDLMPRSPSLVVSISLRGFVVADAPADRLLPGTTITGCSLEAARAYIAFFHGVLQVILISLFGSANRAASIR